MQQRFIHWSLFSILVVTILLACRTAQVFTSGEEARPTLVASGLQQQDASATPIRPRNRPTLTRLAPQQPTRFIPTDEPLPTDLPTPEPPPEEFPTDEPAPTRPPLPTAVPTDAGPTATPAPTRCPKTYCVVYRGCQTEVGNTIIEGVVYNNGVPENGVAVRVARAEGAYPIVEFISGTETTNPGKPDPNNPGKYVLQIQAGRAEEGNWWVFIVDVPRGTKQISEAQLVHTNDDPYNPANCQHAYVDFQR